MDGWSETPEILTYVMINDDKSKQSTTWKQKLSENVEYERRYVVQHMWWDIFMVFNRKREAGWVEQAEQYQRVHGVVKSVQAKWLANEK